MTEIHLTGDKELNRRLAALVSGDVRKITRNAAKAAMRPVLLSAQGRVPYRSGKLQRALRIKAWNRKQSTGAAVSMGDQNFRGETFYGGFQEWGWTTRKRRKSAKGKRSSKLERRGSGRKIAGKHFIEQAGKSKEPRAVAIFGSEVDKSLKAAGL